MTAYEVLRTINTFIDITEIEYNGLIANFHNSFLGERNYEERLMLHRNPVELQNEMLRDVYKDLTTIQRREELRHVHSKGERLISTYVATEIEDVWKADKRLPSLFFAIKEFSKGTGRNFTETAVHQAEFKALCDLAHELQQSIYNHEMAKKPHSSFSKMKSKKIRAKIPREGKVRAELQKEINSVCPFCSSDDVGHFEIHHIDEDPSNNKNDNLLLLCPTCHSKITKRDITLSEVILTKKKIITGLEKRKVPLSKDILIRASVANVISGGSNIINIAQSKKPIKLEFPPGCIGYDPAQAI